MIYENNTLEEIKKILNKEISLIGSAIINYENDNIFFTGFGSKDRLYDYIDRNINCIQLTGVFPNVEIDYSSIKDSALFILKRDGQEYQRYEFLPIIKDTMKFKDADNINRSKVFSIRRCCHTELLSYKDMETSVMFNDMSGLQQYMIEKFGKMLDLGRPVD